MAGKKAHSAVGERSKPQSRRRPAAGKVPPSGKAAAAGKVPAARKWSAKVMRTSDAMDLEPGVFKLRSANAVARSLKRSVEASHRRKSPPFRSAMSMLNFEINRGGKNLGAQQRRVLNAAKAELRRLFHKPPL